MHITKICIEKREKKNRVMNKRKTKKTKTIANNVASEWHKKRGGEKKNGSRNNECNPKLANTHFAFNERIVLDSCTKWRTNFCANCSVKILVLKRARLIKIVILMYWFHSLVNSIYNQIRTNYCYRFCGCLALFFVELDELSLSLFYSLPCYFSLSLPLSLLLTFFLVSIINYTSGFRCRERKIENIQRRTEISKAKNFLNWTESYC